MLLCTTNHKCMHDRFHPFNSLEIGHSPVIVSAGHAHLVYTSGHAATNGSNQGMCLYNTCQITTLKKTDTNYYVIETCP